MFAANTYRIRLANYDHLDAIAPFVEPDSGRPSTGRVLIGYLDGAPAAVLSLDDGRVYVDPSRHTGHLVANLRVRAVGIRADEESNSLCERLLAAVPASFRARVAMGSSSKSRRDRLEHESVLDGDSEKHAGLRHANGRTSILVPA
jgi:hypothetical protein